MYEKVKSALAYAKTNRDHFLKDLFSFASIPSISTDPEHKADIETAALWVAQKLETMGIEAVKIFSTEGHPLVYGQWLLAGEKVPTALVYGHYDVQPADPVDRWDTDPFKPDIQQNNAFARGISDMKGQIIAVLSAIASIINTGNFPINLKFLIEGEEEISRLQRDEQWYLKNTGVPALWGEPEYTPDERVGGRPTLEVHGLKSGFTDEGGVFLLFPSSRQF